MNSELDKYVYLERQPLFQTSSIRYKGNKVTKLFRFIRAIGVLSGKITKFGVDKLHGQIEIGKYAYDFAYVGSNEAILTEGQELTFSFWPSLDLFPKENTNTPSLSLIKIGRIHKKPKEITGQVEIVGKLERLYSDGFLISIPSRDGSIFYSAILGKYEYSDEIGRYICCLARWNDGKLEMVEAMPIAFLEGEDLKEFLEYRKKIRKSREEKKLVIKPNDVKEKKVEH